MWSRGLGRRWPPLPSLRGPAFEPRFKSLISPRASWDPVSARRRLAASVALVFILAAPLGAIGPAAAAPTALASYSLDPIPGLEYIAIAPLAWADHLQPLIDWKSEKGVKAQVFPLQYITSTFAGRDDAEKIHAFLRDLHYNKAPSTRWLLLVGDGDWDNQTIPDREVFTNSQQDASLSNSQNWYTTDTYYGNLESNWDEDGDGIFGELNEGDWTSELYVGRVPVDNIPQLDLWVSRQVTYESNPPPGLWARQAILAGALMDRPNILDNINTGADEGYDPFTDNAWKVDEEVASEMPSWMEVERFYDYPQWKGGGYSRSTDTLTAGAVKGALDQGASFLLLEGHGYTSNRGVAQYDDPTGTASIFRSDAEAPALRYDEVLNLTNGNQMPFVYVSACYAGDFTDRDDTSFEAFLKAPAGGAIAVVAGNGENFRLENLSGQQAFGNWWLAREFFHMLFVEGYSQPGKVLGDLKARYNAYYQSQGPTDAVDRNYFRAERVSYNLMGDPEFSIITQDPANLDARPVRQPLVGEMAVDIVVTGIGGPLTGALVHATGGGADAVAATNATGVARLAFPVADVLPFNLTVTAQNHRPLYTSVVAAQPERDLAFASGGLAASGLPLRNQTLTVEGQVEARGISRFSNVVVEFRLANPTTGLVLSATVLPSVAPGVPQQVQTSVTFDAPGDFLVYAVIDPAGAQSEGTRADNVAFAAVHINAPPKVGALPRLQVSEGGLVEHALSLPAYVTDGESSSLLLAYRILSVSDPRLTVVLDGTDISLMAALGSPPTVTVEFEVSDPFESDRGTIEVSVLRSNHAPVIVPVPPAHATVGVPFSLNLSATDPEGEAVTWSDTSALFDITPAGRIAFTPRAQDIGTFAVTVTVSDGRLSATHSFVLTVAERVLAIEVRNLPVIRTTAGQEVVVDLMQLSPDPEATFVADNGAVRIDAATRTLRYTPSGTPAFETILLSVSKPGFPTTRAAISLDVAGQVPGGLLAGGEGAALLVFALAGAGLAGLAGFGLLRAHQGRLRDERIFMIGSQENGGAKAKPATSPGRPKSDPAAKRRAREEE